MTITRSDISLEVSKRLSISEKDAHAVLNCILDVMKVNLEQANPISLRGFGAFKFKTWKARTGVDPRDRSILIDIPAHNRVRFVPAPQVFSKIVTTKPITLDQPA